MSDKSVKNIAKDVALAAADSCVETALDNLPAAGAFLKDIALDGAAEVLAGSVISAIAPGVYGGFMNYQMRRAERNLMKLYETLANSVDEVNRRLDSLEESVRDKFTTGIYRDVMLDSILSENQPENVQRIVNAFLNLMTIEDLNDDLAVSVFEDLSRLNRLDIRVLRLHSARFWGDPAVGDSLDRLLEEEGIDLEQYQTVREKLCRLGLLHSVNEEKRDKNLEAVQETVSNLIKQLNAKNPKLPNSIKLQKVNLTDSYKITKLGRQYLVLIESVGEDE